MRKLTQEELEKVDEPCKSCDIFATGNGIDLEIWCKAKHAKLMGEGPWYEIIDCPKGYGGLTNLSEHNRNGGGV